MFFVTQIYITILMIQGTVSRTIFHCNSYLVEFWFCSHPSCSEWSLWDFVHGTIAVLSWHSQNVLASWYPIIERVKLKPIFHRIWITMKKALVKWVPGIHGFHRGAVNSPHKGRWRGALMFSLICVWINGWVNNREAGYLICYSAYYDVMVMDM